MKNDYEICGDVTKIFIHSKYGEFETLISTEDLPKVLSEGSVCVHLWDSTPYANIWVKSKKKIVKFHRFLMEAPSDMEVDHINRYGLDNRRENLRICTRAENAKNKRYRADKSHQPKIGVNTNA